MSILGFRICTTGLKRKMFHIHGDAPKYLKHQNQQNKANQF